MINNNKEKATKSTASIKTVEILSIGTELLLGNILNTNSQWLAEEFAKIGINHYFQSVVGDNLDRLNAAVMQSSNRCNLLITTGGLGPTPDDITHEAISACFGVELKEDNESWIDIKNKYKNINRKITNSIRKQSFIPEGATIIPNKHGTAPGIIWSPKKDFTIITFPGVPEEMKYMWKSIAKSWVEKFIKSNHVFTSEIMKFEGISESNLIELIKDLVGSSNPTIASYANTGELKLRVTARAENKEQGNEIIKPIKEIIKSRTDTNYFGNENDSLASIIVYLLSKRGETLSVAESCTGGALASEITKINGSSKIFKGGIIAYSNIIKKNLLGVSEKLLNDKGAVSKEVAESMAIGVRKKMSTDWAISVTGIAGPTGGTKDKPIGLVHFSIIGPKESLSFASNFGNKRKRTMIQQLSVVSSLNRLRLLLLTQS